MRVLVLSRNLYPESLPGEVEARIRELGLGVGGEQTGGETSAHKAWRTLTDGRD